jgi:two-component system, cell cycle sensor histidine kinase and response regulator CckA
MSVVRQFPTMKDDDRHQRFQAIFQSAPIGIGICELSGLIAEVNPEFSRMLGYRQEELANTHVLQLDPCNGKIERQEERENDPVKSHEFSRRVMSGDQRLLGELLDGKRTSFALEKRYRRKDGSELWGLLTVSLGRNLGQQPAFLIALLADASERKRVEEQLRQAEKMEVIGRLAGGIAHDFNNLLTGILLYCDLLSARLGNDLPGGVSARSNNPVCEAEANGDLTKKSFEPRDLCQHVEEVRMAGEQGAALTHQLLAIARKQAAEARPVAMNEIVSSTKNLLRRLIGEHIQLVTCLSEETGCVLVDPAQLRQVLMNLVLNARDALPQGGTIALSTRLTDFPTTPEISKNARELGNGRAVALLVKDNGSGMDEDTRSRLFEPFFTTKKPGAGTGLGLATVQRIVSESGGVIEVESEPGRGTGIEIFFPSLIAH